MDLKQFTTASFQKLSAIFQKKIDELSNELQLSKEAQNAGKLSVWKKIEDTDWIV